MCLLGVYSNFTPLYDEVRWTGHVDRIGQKRDAHRVLVGKPEGKREIARPRCRRIILERIWTKSGSRLDCSGSGWGQVTGCCENGNEPTCSMNCREFD